MSDKKPDFSNVVGGSSSTAEPAPAGTVGAPEPRFYVVQKGDTLSKIAKQFYGNTTDWRRIYQANRDQIKDPDMIQPGWKLTIPEETDDEGGVA
jgi:nucleoid-associated protein YgaU